MLISVISLVAYEFFRYSLLSTQYRAFAVFYSCTNLQLSQRFQRKTSVSTVTRLANIDHNILCLNNFSCLKCILIHLYKLPRFSSSKHSGFITSLFKMFIMITFLLQEICYIIVGLSLFSDVSYNKLLSSSGSILLLSP